MLRSAADIDGIDDAAVFQSSSKDFKSAVFHQIAQIFQFKAETGVRLIASVSGHRLVVRQARKRNRQLLSENLAEKLLEKSFVQLHDIVRLHEGHLHIDLREFRLAVRSQILIPVASGDLIIAVHAGSHQNLLKHLR